MEADDTQIEMENHLRERRQSLALSQKQLADLTGITRQEASALETNQYSPATSVALQLARAHRCPVEDLFSLKQTGEIIEGELLGGLPQSEAAVRAQVAYIGDRVLVRPLHGVGGLARLSNLWGRSNAEKFTLLAFISPRRVRVFGDCLT